MSNHPIHVSDPELEEIIQKLAKKDRRHEHIFRRVLHVVEWFIAAITVAALVISLFVEMYHMVSVPGYFSDVHSILHNLLTIVVGLEFVRMLIDTSPANILEVLTVAITRHVVLTHDDPLSNLSSIACIAALFAIRRYLVRRNELKEEMIDIK